MRTYKPILINEDTYQKLQKIKAGLKRNSEKATFTGIIDSLVSKEYLAASLDEDVQAYIRAFVNEIAAVDDVLGVALFGSVARGTYNSYSDIDLFTVVKRRSFDLTERVYSARTKLHAYEDTLIKKGLYLYISPLIVDIDELSQFRPIYLDIAEDGMILFERNRVLSDFFKRIGKVEKSHESIAGVRVIRWKKSE